MNSYNRKLYILLGLNIFFAIVIVTSLIVSTVNSNRSNSKITLLDQIENVSKISIEGGQSIAINKIDTKWFIPSEGKYLPVEQGRVKAFLLACEAIHSGELMSKSKDSWKNYGLNTESTRTVKLLDGNGKNLGSFIVGNYASTNGKVYIALEQAENVYSVDSAIANYVSGSLNSWLDLKIIPETPALEEIQSVSIDGNLTKSDDSVISVNYEFKRNSVSWTDGENKLDSVKIDSLVRTIIGLRAESYASPSEDMKEVTLRIVLQLGSGRSIAISIEDKNADGRYALTSNQRDFRMYIPSWSITEIVKPLESYFAAR